MRQTTVPDSEMAVAESGLVSTDNQWPTAEETLAFFEESPSDALWVTEILLDAAEELPKLRFALIHAVLAAEQWRFLFEDVQEKLARSRPKYRHRDRDELITRLRDKERMTWTDIAVTVRENPEWRETERHKKFSIPACRMAYAHHKKRLAAERADENRLAKHAQIMGVYRKKALESLRNSLTEETWKYVARLLER